jgi:Ni/Co efflux regulator RcnB
MKKISLAILALTLLATPSFAQRGGSHGGGAMHGVGHAGLAQANTKQDKDRDPSPDNDNNKGKHKGETKGKHKAKGHRH